MVAYVGERRTGTVARQLPEVGVTTPGTDKMSEHRGSLNVILSHNTALASGLRFP
jgi:hypothetical protein